VRWQFTEPAILLLLRDGPSHGYQLLGRLRSLAPSTAAAPDTSVVYRLLRGLEAEGFLRSSWADNPGAGPARHVYELTDSGRNKLDGWLSAIAEEIQAMSRLLATYYSR
jgi:DNA-binding PadR family transcriptional regulator